MDVHEKLQYLLDERGWTKYQLARKCGLSDATIANIFRRNTMPSIPTLEAICQGYGITLSQFFAEGEMVELTPDLKENFLFTGKSSTILSVSFQISMIIDFDS